MSPSIHLPLEMSNLKFYAKVLDTFRTVGLQAMSSTVRSVVSNVEKSKENVGGF